MDYNVVNAATMSSNDEDSGDDEEEHQIDPEFWLPRRSLIDTNWLYHVDALRIHDNHEMNSRSQVYHMLLMHTMNLSPYAFVIQSSMRPCTYNRISLYFVPYNVPYNRLYPYN